jgi:hypothetical protein
MTLFNTRIIAKGLERGVDDDTINRLETLEKSNKLTCTKIFELSRELNTEPKTIADAVHIMGIKIRTCQLGCF